jgi:TonB family protein
LISSFAQDVSIEKQSYLNQNIFTGIPNVKFSIDSIDANKFVVTKESAQGNVLANKRILENLLKRYKDQNNINFRVLLARRRYAGNQMDDYTKAFNVTTEAPDASRAIGEKTILIIYFKEERRVYIYPSISYQKQLSSDYLDSLLVKEFIDTKYPDEYVAIGHLCLDLVKTISDDFIVDSLDEKTGRFWGYLRIASDGKKFNSYEPPYPSRIIYPRTPFTLRPAVEEGNLSVNFTINTDGTIKDIAYAIKGDRVNELFLKKIFSDWKFIPAMKNGIPCLGKIILNFDFSSNSNNDARLKSRKVDNSTKSLADAISDKYEISKLDQIPVATVQVHPQYPFELRIAGISGQVVVDYIVDVEGNVRNAFAASSSRSEFESPAVDAVSKWKFRPGIINGQPVATHMQVPIVFTANNDHDFNAPLVNINIGNNNSAIKSVDIAPKVIFQVHPIYPDEMRSKGISGEFVVRYTVTEKGDVENASVIRVSYWIQDSRGNKKTVIVDDSEKFEYKKGEANFSYAVSRWKFKPAIKNGVPVSITLESPLVVTMVRDE